VRSPRIRDRLARREQRKSGSLHRILSRLDPAAAARIHPSDKNKTIRALEVRLLEGRPLSALFKLGREPLTGFQPIKLGLDPPRDLLYRKLDARSERMFESGLIAEARDLLAAGVPVDAKPFESLGYRQALDVVQERLTLEQALACTQAATRRYAKRQLTWFRKEHSVHWLQGFGDDEQVQDQALAVIQQTVERG
jgi:tRNA dimethylallyltransferase